MHKTTKKAAQVNTQTSLNCLKFLICLNCVNYLNIVSCRSMEKAGSARPVWNGGSKFQVTMTEGGHQIVVDLKERTCACRKWQLTGIPCFHACSCILFQKESPLDYMHECHNREWYLRVYGHVLEPINGEQYWEETHETPLLPPNIKVAPGRPKKNREKKGDVVQTRPNDPTMLKRTGTSGRCGWCREWGHNTRTCTSKVLLNCSFYDFNTIIRSSNYA